MNVQAALGELDLLPLQVAHLGGPQTVAIGDQDHGRVAMPIAAVLARAVHQSLDLALGEVAPRDCQVYDAWGAFLGCRFHADKLCLRVADCLAYTHFVHSKGGAAAWSASRSQCRMEAPGRVREPRANLILSCRRTSIMNPPVGGTFWFQIFIQAPSPEIWSETISGAEGGSGAVSGVACFGLPPWKKFSAANFVGCTTGKSAGCSPLRMRPV